MAIIYYSLMWFSLGLLLGGLYEQHRNNKVVKNTSTNNAIMPCANCSKCHCLIIASVLLVVRFVVVSMSRAQHNSANVGGNRLLKERLL